MNRIQKTLGTLALFGGLSGCSGDVGDDVSYLEVFQKQGIVYVGFKSYEQRSYFAIADPHEHDAIDRSLVYMTLHIDVDGDLRYDRTNVAIFPYPSGSSQIELADYLRALMEKSMDIHEWAYSTLDNAETAQSIVHEER